MKAWRQQQLHKFELDPTLIDDAKEYYKYHTEDFINDWCDTYDPRRIAEGLPAKIPFILFTRQAELIQFLEECVKSDAPGLIEKCRDMGATWVCCAFSDHLFLFWEGSAIGWGSRKQEYVDRIGDPSSIFEKMRMILRGLPEVFLPKGFSFENHSHFMRLVNPENGSTIIGEIGDDIGRGGRTSLFFKDEAQPLYSEVLTPYGWDRIGDIAVGDLVIGSNGKSTKVIGVNDCGFHKVYKITFMDGTSTECSENHLWTVDSVLGGVKRVTKRTKDLIKDYIYTSPQGITLYRYKLPEHSAVEFKLVEELPLSPYIVGALLGDGAISDEEVTPRIVTPDQEIIERIVAELPEGCELHSTSDPLCWSLCDVKGRSGKGKVSRSRQAVIDAGISGKRSYGKFIPSKYLFSSIDDRIALLQGLMDTDGSATNGGYGGGSASFHTSSYELAKGVLFIVQSLGGRATLNTRSDKRKSSYKDQHVLHIALPKSVVPFTVKRKLDQWKVRKQSVGCRIRNIEYCGKKEVRCISVEAEDGLYLTDNCILTHNSAHYARPEKIEAALSENTRCPIDISSVNSPNNVFYRKREAGVDWAPGQEMVKNTTNVFVMDWSDHPEKTKEWHAARKAQFTADGLLHVFNQEIERNYFAAVQGTMIDPEWFDAAVDAHIKLGIKPSGARMAGFDVADEGRDKNALSIRLGILVQFLAEWGYSRDVGASTRKAISFLEDWIIPGYPLLTSYDCIGIGAGVKAEWNRLIGLDDEHGERKAPDELSFSAWNAAAAIQDPYKPVVEQLPGDKKDEKPILNRDFFGNLKAQAWWTLARRFEKTYRAVTEKDFTYDPDDLIAIPKTLPLKDKLKKELCQPTASKNAHLKMIVDKTPEGTRSPNLADSLVMNFFPVKGPDEPHLADGGVTIVRPATLLGGQQRF